MKKFFYFLSIVALSASCSLLNEPELEEIDELAIALEQNVLGTISIGDNVYLLNENENNSITKFVNRKKKYKFTYNESSLNLKDPKSEFNFRTETSNFRLENTETGEFIDMINIVSVTDDQIEFDIMTSEGVLLEDFIINAGVLNSGYENSRVECWQCYIYPALKLAEIIIDALGDNIDSNCAKAIESCGQEGPKSVEITEGWFSNSCKVECK